MTKKKLKDYPLDHEPLTMIDENGKIRVKKIAVDKNNNLVCRYYLPTSEKDRLIIKGLKQCTK
jgi:hypothetical protein